MDDIVPYIQISFIRAGAFVALRRDRCIRLRALSPRRCVLYAAVDYEHYFRVRAPLGFIPTTDWLRASVLRVGWFSCRVLRISFWIFFDCADWGRTTDIFGAEYFAGMVF